MNVAIGYEVASLVGSEETSRRTISMQWLVSFDNVQACHETKVCARSVYGYVVVNTTHFQSSTLPLPPCWSDPQSD